MRRPVRLQHEQGVTFVELFFDLVFVYAVTQLTSSVLHDLTWPGVGHAALLFWLVWWAWTQFTWTLNLADTEHALIRLPVLAATAAAFFLAQAVPDAFGDAGLWFASSYVTVRLLGLGLQEWIGRVGERPSAALDRWVGLSLVGLLLVLTGGIVEGDLRVWLWGGALAADLVAATLAGESEWEIVPGHFAERHGLIVIIALGESLIAAGVATADVERGGLFALTATGAVLATCALWWTYFGTLHERLAEALSETAHRGSFARDVYSFWHAIVVFGVIGIAVGFEEAIAHPADPLPAAAGWSLAVGAVLFVGGATGAARRAGIRDVLAPRAGFMFLALLLGLLGPLVDAGGVLWGLVALAGALAAIETGGSQARPGAGEQANTSPPEPAP
ncbi:MAG: low temperature requirement protein A [Nitriliruptorales bacterium]|nr:low temperature requirement protein A [Nitriliruptorales bacterium]